MSRQNPVTGPGPVDFTTCLVDTNGNPYTAGSGSSTTPAVVTEQGLPSLATAQATANTTATQLVAARATRGGVLITNLGTTPVYIGAAGVTTATGSELPGVRGASVTIPTRAAIFGVVGTGTQAVSVLEVF